MTRAHISPHPVLTTSLVEQMSIEPVLRFFSSRVDPGAEGKWGEQCTLGHDSDWDPCRDDLEIRCFIPGIKNFGKLFSLGGVAPKSATLALALEWFSSDSGWRQLGEPVFLHCPEDPDDLVTVQLSLTLPANSLRGTGILSIQLMLGDVGAREGMEDGQASIPGFRFGMLGPDTRVVIDGDGSLFPIVVESLGVDKPLWSFSRDWCDPYEDEFSAVWLSLSLNEDHPDFRMLHQSGSQLSTPLFCQVLASWLAIFLMELRAELGDEFDTLIVDGRSDGAARGSIVDAAASMVRRGSLNCASPCEMIRSIQAWVDKVVRPGGASE